MKSFFPWLIIVLVLYWLVFRIYHDSLFLRRPRLNALGTVIGYRRIKQDGGQLSLPIIRFESDDSRTIEFTNSWGSFFHELDVGSVVAVEYPAGLPDKARIVGSYSPLLAYGLIAVALAALAVFIAFPNG
jgi:uncharacterized protein DUF3592